MLETAEVGARVEKGEYENALPQLRVDLLNAQFELRDGDFPVVVVLTGDDHDGISEVLNLLHGWMDPRYLDAHFFDERKPEEIGYPRLWRYWQVMPGRGEIGLYAGGYGLGLLADHITGEHDGEHAARRTEHARRVEQTLTNGGALLLKIWLHLPVGERRKRLKKARKQPKSTRLTSRELELYARGKDAEPLIEAFLRKTSSAAAPWVLIESSDSRHRNLRVAGEIRDALVRRLAQPPAAPAPSPSGAPPAAAPSSGVLASLDLGVSLARDEYRERVDAAQKQLRQLGLRCREQGISGCVVLEGWDAAGKGGIIRRITSGMDVRDYRVMPVAAPTPEELAHHYLWRFWRRLPRAGRLLICDRSWYGRVLVERVEGLAREDEWMRGYEEINDFEDQLVEYGRPVMKFWLHMDPDTQLERFRARSETPYKKYKLTPEDHRNRENWDAYVAAVEDMVARTSTDLAPWHLVPANDKRHARVQVLETVCEALERSLGENAASSKQAAGTDPKSPGPKSA